MPQSSANQFSGIFISYRRDDSSGHAGRLFDKLVDHFGKDRIFMDIDTIEPGEDFIAVIENAVTSCDVLLAIIGKRWLSGSDRGSGRLDNPNDFVRLEIGTALSRDIRVIPVLVQRARMPNPQEVPDDLVKLTRRNAVELSDLRWQNDVDQLIHVLEKVLTKRDEAARQAEAAKQAEQEKQLQEEEQKRLAEEKKLRQAQQEAKQRAADEQRKKEEERKRKEAEERARQEAQIALKRRAEEERVQAEIETRKLAEKDAERRRIEAEQKAERQRLEAEKRNRDERARIQREAEAAERNRALSLQGSRKENQNKADLPTIITTPASEQPTQLFDSKAIPQTPASDVRSKVPTVLIITASVVVLSFIAVVILAGVILIRQTEGEQQSANPNTTPANSQLTGQPEGAPPTRELPQPPAGMVYVPGAKFTMGRHSNDSLETPTHQVTVKPFFMDMYEVTCEEYKKFLDANPDHAAPNGWVYRNYPAGSARKPVTGVDWDDAVKYAAWCGKRLPREEEWELAARGTDSRLYPWGNEWKAGLANTGKPEAGPNDGALGMSDVGTYKGKSPYGAYDMVGNAWEWTASDFRDQGGKFPSAADSGRDLKVIRGGSWASQSDQATATFRRWYGARGEKRGYSYTGIRLVKDINE
ncbi:MAG TPA: SUMF1/EgtB/PvdO family nonheme iron enzyme [Pyrinomonadaceae bacterium]|jgi:formylglycine-generating enzyme required for sulfatase activity